MDCPFWMMDSPFLPLHSHRIQSQSAVERRRMHGVEQMKRKERVEGNSVTRLFLVVFSRHWWREMLKHLHSSPACPNSYLLSAFPPQKTSPKPSVYPNITIGTKAVCSQKHPRRNLPNTSKTRRSHLRRQLAGNNRDSGVSHSFWR